MATASSPLDEIKMNFLTLSFPGKLEEAFLDDYFQKSLRHVRIALLLGLFFYGIFGILDAWIVPEVKQKLWIIRYAVFSPFLFIVLLFSFSAHFKKYMQLSIAGVVLAAGLGIVAMIVIAPYPGNYSYYAGLILVFLFGYTFFKLRFIWATLTGWTIVIAYEISAVWLSQTPIPILVNNNFFFLAGNIIGMFACYSIESYSRKAFMQARQLEAEKKKVSAANRDLEKRVEERTAQLIQTNEELTQEIAGHKRTGDALKESEQQFKSLSENSPEIIYTLGLNGLFTYVNPAWEKVLGHPSEEVIGKYFVHFVRKEDARFYMKQFKGIRDEKQTIRDITGALLHRDGSTRLFSLSGAPNIDKEGKVRGMIGLLKDITEQQRLQAKLEQAKKMEIIGTLAGGVAHDLNNILSGLVSYPEMLLLDLPEDSPLREPILKIQQSGEKVSAIVQDLLTLARRGITATEVVNLNDIIFEYMKSLEYERSKSFHPDIQVEINLHTNLLNILGSPVHLSKTLMNLISNAMEAMVDGGKILIMTENRYIERPIRGYDDVKEGDYVVLSVSDTGIGISSEDMKRIFEPFYTKKTMGRSGTGLGMTVIWGTVKDHKGYIDVKSAEGKGTTFTLYFPVSQKVLAEDKSRLSIDDIMGKGESILVVDDEEEQREIASRMLNKLGYSITSVSSGEEAVNYMKDNSADLLVLDMIMDPGIDGLETYKRILEFYTKQKAIIVSGFSETKRVKEAQRVGVGAYLEKSFLFEKIGLSVKSELDKEIANLGASPQLG